MSITRNGTNQYHVLPDMMHWKKTTHRFCYIPGKNAELQSSHEATSDKLKLRNIIQNNWPVLFKNVKKTKPLFS